MCFIYDIKYDLFMGISRALYFDMANHTFGRENINKYVLSTCPRSYNSPHLFEQSVWY